MLCFVRQLFLFLCQNCSHIDCVNAWMNQNDVLCSYSTVKSTMKHQWNECCIILRINEWYVLCIVYKSLGAYNVSYILYVTRYSTWFSGGNDGKVVLKATEQAFQSLPQRSSGKTPNFRCWRLGALLEGCGFESNKRLSYSPFRL